MTDELDQLCYVEYIEKGYIQLIELRGIDAGHEVLQIFADPSVIKRCENGEDRACRGRGTSA